MKSMNNYFKGVYHSIWATRYFTIIWYENLCTCIGDFLPSADVFCTVTMYNKYMLKMKIDGIK